MLEYEKIMGLKVSDLSYEKLIKHINSDIITGKKSTIIAINPEKMLKAKKDNALKDLLNSATYRIADGIGVIIASKLKKGKISKRITGIDCMNLLLELSANNQYKVFLYGAKKEVLEKAKLEIKNQYKGINIVGSIDGYQKNQKKIIEEINKSNADILFVALGSPKQEYWINKNKDKLNVKIFQGVGGSFDVISRNIKRAPKWMRKSGLEWFYRLTQEPKRIFRQLNLFRFLILILFSEKEN